MDFKYNLYNLLKNLLTDTKVSFFNLHILYL